MVARTGNCFDSAGAMFMDDHDRLTLVHGLPLGMGGDAKGLRYPHAWVEWTTGYGVEMVYDTVAKVEIPKSAYYALGNIEYAVRYDWDAFREEVTAAEHWGPWDEAIVEADRHIDALMEET